MPFSTYDIVVGAVVPLLVSGVVFALIRLACNHKEPARHAAAVAIAAAFVTAYALFDWTKLVPQEHWQWLPYLALAAMSIGPTSIVVGIGRFERWSLFVVIAAAAAWFLVPEWRTLDATRPWHFAVVGGGVFLLCVFLEPLAKRMEGRGLPLAMLAISTAGSAVLALSGNLKFAQLSGAVVAALLGILLATFVRRVPMSFRGATPAYAVLMGGLMYAGRVNSFSEVPPASYALIAAAPLMLWSVAVGPLANVSKRWQITARVAAVTLPLAVALLLAVLPEFHGSGSGLIWQLQL